MVDPNIVLGTIGSQPSSGSYTVSYNTIHNSFSIEVNLNEARIPITDADAMGSYGTLNCFLFTDTLMIVMSASAVQFTQITEGPGISGAGDAVYVIAAGTEVTDAPEDGTLNGDDIALVDDLINGASSGGSLAAPIQSIGLLDTAKQVPGTGAFIAVNWSGTAASIDASGYIDVTGRIVITGTFA